jgi:hypothetical protein
MCRNGAACKRVLCFFAHARRELRAAPPKAGAADAAAKPSAAAAATAGGADKAAAPKVAPQKRATPAGAPAAPATAATAVPPAAAAPGAPPSEALSDHLLSPSAVSAGWSSPVHSGGGHAPAAGAGAALGGLFSQVSGCWSLSSTDNGAACSACGADAAAGGGAGAGALLLGPLPAPAAAAPATPAPAQRLPQAPGASAGGLLAAGAAARAASAGPVSVQVARLMHHQQQELQLRQQQQELQLRQQQQEQQRQRQQHHHQQQLLLLHQQLEQQLRLEQHLEQPPPQLLQLQPQQLQQPQQQWVDATFAGIAIYELQAPAAPQGLGHAASSGLVLAPLAGAPGALLCPAAPQAAPALAAGTLYEPVIPYPGPLNSGLPAPPAGPALGHAWLAAPTGPAEPCVSPHGHALLIALRD